MLMSLFDLCNFLIRIYLLLEYQIHGVLETNASLDTYPGYAHVEIRTNGGS